MKGFRRVKSILYIIILFLLFNIESHAWIYPEHRDITLCAIETLSEDYKTSLDNLWTVAIVGYENRLTHYPIDLEQSTSPTLIDYAAWPAIAGDHSTSSQDMLNNILKTDWILKVAHIAAQLKIDLASSENKYDHINSLRDSDINLQRVDPHYATRAGSNNVHFLLARPKAEILVRDYLLACLKEGAELNSLGAYTWFHLSALEKAAKYQSKELSDEEKRKLILSAFADEAFALHFLEDAFASGHTAGTWGDASQRKGTHDYYNEKGLEAVTWNGQRIVLTGDAFMRPKDKVFAAVAVKESLVQFLDAASGKFAFDYSINGEIENQPDEFNVSTKNFMPKRKVDKTAIDSCAQILIKTPIPGLADGLGEFPRFRAELGTFIGVISAVRGNTLSGGFGTHQTQPGVNGGIDAGVRVGLGLEGVMHGGGDGLVFFEFSWRQDAASSMKFGETPNLERGGQISAAIPGREAYSFRLRMPFWLIPFDLLVSAPILLIVSPDTYAGMAVTSGLGGLIPWQAGIETAIGRFQFILGREVGVSFYGRGETIDALLIPENNQTYLVNYRSTQLDFPILEYRPFRSFSLDQSSSLVIQFNFGVDIPHNKTLVVPEDAAMPELRPVWYLGMRTAFDWRYYW